MNRGKQLDDILKNINTEDTWIDVQTVAALKNITQRAVRLAIRQDKYISKVETVRGGKCYKIKLSSLEPELQAILNNTVNYFLSFAILLLIMSLLPIATNFGVQILQKIIKVDKSKEHNIFYYTDLYKLDLTTFISIMQTEYKLHNISIFDKKIIEQIIINAKILKLKVFYHTLAYFVL